MRLKSGDLKLTNGNDVSDQNLQSFNHDDAGASFSADSYLNNISNKYSALAALTLTPNYAGDFGVVKMTN